MALLRIEGLPDEPLAAAAAFHAEWLPRAQALLAGKGGDLTLLFEAADHAHRGWRVAAIQGLAREYAPYRVNGVAGGGDAAVSAAADYLARAEGLTGQYLPLDDVGAGAVLGLAS